MNSLPEQAEHRVQGYKTYLGQEGLFAEGSPCLYAISPYFPTGRRYGSPVFVYKCGRAEKFGDRMDRYATYFPYAFFVLAAVEVPKSKLAMCEKMMFDMLEQEAGAKRLYVPVRTERQEKRGEWWGGSVSTIHKVFQKIKDDVKMHKKNRGFYLNEEEFEFHPEFFGAYFPSE